MFFLSFLFPFVYTLFLERHPRALDEYGNSLFDITMWGTIFSWFLARAADTANPHWSNITTRTLFPAIFALAACDGLMLWTTQERRGGHHISKQKEYLLILIRPTESWNLKIPESVLFTLRFHGYTTQTHHSLGKLLFNIKLLAPYIFLPYLM